MVRVSIWTAIVAAAVALGASRPAEAQQLQSFPSRESLNSAANNELAVVDFENLLDFDSYVSLTYPGLSISSTNTANFSLMALGPATFPALPSSTLISIDASNAEPSPLILEFSSPITALGIDLMAFAPDGIVTPAGCSFLITVEGSGGSQTSVLPLTEGAPTFLGLGASGGTISRVIIANPPGQQRFVSADNVSYGNLPAGVGAVLDEIEELLATAKAAGKIGKLGSSLEDKLAEVRSSVDLGNSAEARSKLRAFANQIRAQRGKKIVASTADELVALINDALALL